jgi:hypothetical protein
MDEFLEKTFVGLLLFVLAASIIVSPIALVVSASRDAAILTEACGRHVSTVDALLSGETLKTVCRIENQTIQVK